LLFAVDGGAVFVWMRSTREPALPAPPIPSTVTDLTRFSVATARANIYPAEEKHNRRPLTDTPAIEVLRGTAREDGTPDAKSLRVVETIPGELVAKI